MADKGRQAGSQQRPRKADAGGGGGAGWRQLYRQEIARQHLGGVNTICMAYQPRSRQASVPSACPTCKEPDRRGLNSLGGACLVRAQSAQNSKPPRSERRHNMQDANTEEYQQKQTHRTHTHNKGSTTPKKQRTHPETRTSTTTDLDNLGKADTCRHMILESRHVQAGAPRTMRYKKVDSTHRSELTSRRPGRSCQCSAMTGVGCGSQGSTETREAIGAAALLFEVCGVGAGNGHTSSSRKTKEPPHSWGECQHMYV